MVDAVHQALPDKITNAAFVSADGLQHRDKVHFDRASYIAFGKRYAEAYRKLRE